MTEQFYYLCWMLGHSPSKALPVSHVVPFRKDTLITLYPLHPAGICPNYNCVYLVTRFAQYRTQRHHCSGPLYKGTCLASPSRLESKSRASSKMLLILLSVALLALSSAQDLVSGKNNGGGCWDSAWGLGDHTAVRKLANRRHKWKMWLEAA